MYEQYYKEFIKQFHYLSEKHDKHNVFLDFLKISSFSMYNAFLHSQEIEEKYLSVVSKYEKSEIEIFVKMFSNLILMYESKGEITDILGELYMKERMESKDLNQFFTPFHIAEFMGKINCGTKEEMQKIIDKNGYITLSEPCCGAGAMILGFAKALKDEDINYQQDLLVYAVDISEVCTYMTYIQLSLYGIPAIVYCGETLSMKMNFHLETPLYFMNYWKFRNRKNTKNDENNETDEIIEKENIIKFNEVTKNGVCQMSFF